MQDVRCRKPASISSRESSSERSTGTAWSQFSSISSAVAAESVDDNATADEEIHSEEQSLIEAEMLEPSSQIALQVFFPYVVAGLGMVGAGAVLNIVKQWKVFVNISEIVILVPALLGLKGNLEMTLASRLSTQVNLGNMEVTAEQLSIAGGNLVLTQVQAVVVGFLSSIFAILLSWIRRRKLNFRHGILLMTSSVLTASLASLILGSLVIGVVMLSRRCHINPDNVATPIAGSLGDLTTIMLLAAISSTLAKNLESGDHLLFAPLLLFVVFLVVPILCYVAHNNKYTCDVLYSGWMPVIGAMVISSFGGLILDHTISSFEGIAMFQPVINGIGGNLVAIQASRLSTALHKTLKQGIAPENSVHGCPELCSSIFGATAGARSARVLLVMVIPGQLIFTAAIWWLHRDEWMPTFGFVIAYLVAALTQVALLLHVANWLVHWLWSHGSDPDNSSIPYLTAFGDLLGAILLAFAFYVSS